MKTITAIIEKGTDGGFNVFSPQVQGAYAPAPTEEDAKQEFLEMLNEIKDFYVEQYNELPEWYDENLEINYEYSLSGFFEAFPFINATEFAKVVGLNPSLMRRYKLGIGGISQKQKQKLQTEFSKIVGRMAAVHF